MPRGATSASRPSSRAQRRSSCGASPSPGSRQACAESLTAISASPLSRGCTVSNRSSKLRRKAYQSGLRRPALSIAAQEIDGQMSLSCQDNRPIQTGDQERKCSIPRRNPSRLIQRGGPMPVVDTCRRWKVCFETTGKLAVSVVRLLVQQNAGRLRCERIVVDRARECGPRRRALESELSDERGM